MTSLVSSARAMVAAPPEVVFAILADPRQHSRIDGSGTVRGPVSGPEKLALGSEFGMDMKMGAPYKIKNRVVEFEQDRLIAWRHVGQHRWRYELTPVADGTEVTESWDASYYNAVGRAGMRLSGFPRRNLRGIEQTLVKLKASAESDAGSVEA